MAFAMFIQRVARVCVYHYILTPVSARSIKTANMGKRKTSTDGNGTNQSSVPATATSSQAEVEEADGSKKPRKARKPTAKQLEEAEIAARVIYTEDMRPAKYDGAALRVISWNVASLNSTLTKDKNVLRDLIDKEKADVLCLQETKLQEKKEDEMQGKIGLPGWHFYWNSSSVKLGYSGTAMLSRLKPLSIRRGMGKDPQHDTEGRMITAEFQSCFVVNVYTPNSGDGLKRLEYRTQSWDPTFADFVEDMQKKKPVLVIGDLNCAPQPIDIHAPSRNLKSAGFTPEERDSFARNLIDRGLVDAFRKQHPDIAGYTYWSFRTNARSGNKGWRLDLALLSAPLAEKVHDCFHLPSFAEEKKLSDHCPVGVVLKLE